VSATVGILAQPLARHTDAGRYWRAVIWKANPRSAEYMRDLFAGLVPDGVVVDAGRGMAEALATADRVLLLYPDAVGLGWGRIERAVRDAAPASSSIEVLNGRRRGFALDGGTRRALWLRRVLERTMLVELVAAGAIVGGAPLLWALDALRGRR
jgi:hypothetical protein